MKTISTMEFLRKKRFIFITIFILLFIALLYYKTFTIVTPNNFGGEVRPLAGFIEIHISPNIGENREIREENIYKLLASSNLEINISSIRHFGESLPILVVAKVPINKEEEYIQTLSSKYTKDIVEVKRFYPGVM